MSITYDKQQSHYWCRLTQGLLDEARSMEVQSGRHKALAKKIEQLQISVTSTQASQGYIQFSESYRALACRLGDSLGENESIADTYNSMDEFWSALKHQAAGEDTGTTWDSYEHGRRRMLERDVAQATGAEAAVLTSTGMAAITAALESRLPIAGTKILIPTKQYFEIDELFTGMLRSRGCIIQTADFSDQPTLDKALSEFRPDIAFFETVANAIDLCSASGVNGLLHKHPEVVFIADNTVYSLSDMFWCRGEPFPRNLLVVEGATKTISRTVMVGVIYGSKDLVETARVTARTCGALLSGRTCCYIRSHEIGLVGERLELHRRNTETFMSIVGGSSSAAIKSPMFQRDKNTKAITAGLIFFSISPESQSEITALRVCAANWNNRLKKSHLKVPVRGGFGWDETTLRIYETSNLNQADAPNYMRISIGIEPHAVIQEKAIALKTSLEEADV
jgi:Cys/Met metabolism PLP-dependent enzyme